jgi:hypothetical protein
MHAVENMLKLMHLNTDMLTDYTEGKTGEKSCNPVSCMIQ